MKKFFCLFSSMICFIVSFTGCITKDETNENPNDSSNNITNEKPNNTPNNAEDCEKPNESSTPNNDAQNKFKLIIEVEGNGVVEGAGEYEKDKEVCLKAVEESNSKFVCWKDENGNIISKSLQYKIVIKHNLKLKAIFEKRSVEIALSINGRGYVEGAGDYWIGDYAILNALPSDHSQFIRWEDEEGNLFSESIKLSIIAQKNLHLTAVFIDTYKTCNEYVKYESYKPEYVELDKKVQSAPIFAVNTGNTTTTIYKSATVSNGVIFEFGNWQTVDADFQLQLSELNENAVTQNWSMAINIGGSKGSINTGIKFGYSVQNFISNTKGLITTYSYPLTGYNPNYLYKVVLIGDYEIITKEVCQETIIGFNPGSINYTYESTINIVDFSKCKLALVCKKNES